MGNLYLGLDSSTQSLSAVLVDLELRRVVYSASLNYASALPHYGTQDGVLRGEDPTVIHAPPLMWVEALDVLFQQMVEVGVPMAEIRAVSGSGQQHGSVYLNPSAKDALAQLDPAHSLVENLAGVFSRRTAPIWMDSSTPRECREITDALAPHGGVLNLTGSAATERFTGPQIRKFRREDPDGYAATSHIALVSSFLCSLLSGRIAPIDPGDGAGMNLMDIRRKDWCPSALDATAPGLREKLPTIAPSGTVVGPIHPYFVRRYGLSESAQSVIWSGDNPCSVVGLGLVRPGLVAISMGTSYTYFGTMDDCRVDPRGEGHVFGSPAGGYMTLNCFKNGGLARARMRDRFQLDWAGFAAAIESTPPGNRGRLMLPWFDTEIVPRVLVPGERRLDLSEDDMAGNCRAVVEGQMMAMRVHADWMGDRPSIVFATGGASEDRSVLQVMADVFNCPAQPFAISKSAALGAALIAAEAWHRHARRPVSWSEIVAGFTDSDSARRVLPRAGAAAEYERLLPRYAQFEADELARRA